MPTIGLTGVLAALSLATDLGSGFAPEKGLRTCLAALAVGRQVELDDGETADLFQGALLQSLGCTAFGDYVSHGPHPAPAEGPEGVKARIAVYQDSLDGFWDIQELISAGEDRVVVRWIGRGTHTGELMGVPPTGAAIAVEAITVVRLAGGKIAEERTVWDALGLLQQVGAVPAPA
jgi:hypothetical protein